MTTVVLNTVTRKVEVFSSARDVQARAEIADHKAAADPHPQYLADADLADVALSGDAGDLTAGTVPDARMPNWTGYNVASRTALQAANVPAAVVGLRLLGYAAVGDGGAAQYKRVGAAPAHAGKIQSADGAWWEITEREITPQMLGVVGDGVTDDASGFAGFFSTVGALAATGYVPAATYIINSNVTQQNYDVDVACAPGAIFDGSDFAVNDAVFTFGAGLAATTALPALGANVVRGDLIVTFASAPPLAQGDVFLICDNDDYSWFPLAHGGRTYYKKGEMLEVKEVSGNDVYVTTPVADSYLTTDNLLNNKLTLRTVNWKGGHFIGNPALAFMMGVKVEQGRNLVIEDVSGFQNQVGLIAARRCHQGNIIHPVVRSPQDFQTIASNAKEYGITLMSCHEVNVVEPNITVGRHAVTFTGGNIVLPIPNRRCFVKGGYLKAGHYATDMHGSCDECGWLGVDIHGGAQYGGRRPIVKGCKITGLYGEAGSQAGAVLADGEQADSNLTFIDLDLHPNNEVPVPTKGLLCFSGVRAFEGGHVNIRGVRLHSISGSDLTKGLDMDWSADLGSDVSIAIQSVSCSSQDTAPVLDITFDSTSTGICKRLMLSDIEQLAPRLTGRFEYGDVSADNHGSIAMGLRLVLQSHTAQQYVRIQGSHIFAATATGIRIEGPGTSTDTIVEVVNNTALNNNQTMQPAEFRGSLYASSIGTLIMADNTFGDTQATATQTRAYYLTTMDKVRLGYNRVFGGVTESAEASVTFSGPLATIERDPTLVIASGVVTAWARYHLIDTEAAASIDDLDTINGGQIGDMLILRTVNSGRDVVLKNATGNIFTHTGADITITSAGRPHMLIKTSNTQWRTLTTNV